MNHRYIQRGANQSGSESAMHGANQPGGKQARRQTSREVNKPGGKEPGGESARGRTGKEVKSHNSAGPQYIRALHSSVRLFMRFYFLSNI